jgi:DNA (cytosine-5)-methyltransferase 1
MKYLSLCSGIEAASVAWHHMGWQPTAFSEIEPFPSAVLAHHYPQTPNWGDMTRFKEWPDANINVLVGGTPCQSFSVAGLRKGLDDPRGNLMLTYLAIANRYRPEWVVWENVPGVLSSNSGRDFGAFLGGLGQLGYGFAYRVLDAQYFGLAQRRRRVFVVGCLGGWQRAAAVLFEQHSLQGHSAPSRKTGKTVANCLGASPASSGCPNVGNGQGNVVSVDVFNHSTSDVAHTVSARNDMQTGAVMAWPAEIACTLNAAFGSKQGLEDQHALNGAPLFVPDTLGTMTARMFNALGARDVEEGALLPISFGAQMSQPQTDVDMVQTLQAKNPMAVAFGVSERPTVGHCLRSGASKADKPESTTNVAHVMQVRRLTPVECERLQGFPDNYTNIPWRKKPESPDGPRYKALGNSMAVPVMRWIGERINQVEQI